MSFFGFEYGFGRGTKRKIEDWEQRKLEAEELEAVEREGVERGESEPEVAEPEEKGSPPS